MKMNQIIYTFIQRNRILIVFLKQICTSNSFTRIITRDKTFMMSDRVIQIRQNNNKFLSIKTQMLILNSNLPGQVLHLLTFCNKIIFYIKFGKLCESAIFSLFIPLKKFQNSVLFCFLITLPYFIKKTTYTVIA